LVLCVWSLCAWGWNAGLALAQDPARTPETARTQDAVLPQLTRGPYLQLATPKSIVIVWRTSSDIQPTVRWGTQPGQWTGTSQANDVTLRVAPPQPLEPAKTDAPAKNDAPAKTTESPQKNSPQESGKEKAERKDEPLEEVASSVPLLHSAPPRTVQYEVHIDNLKPATTYYYAVFDGTRLLAGGDAEHRFQTHPEVGTKSPFRFWVVGDSGTGDAAQKAAYEGIKTELQKPDAKPLDFYLHVGDMAYPKGTDREFQTKFFDIYQPTLRQVVCWASMGNHEGATSKGISGIGPYFDAYVCPTQAEAGGVPSATEAYYSFDYGHAHFVCLDSHDLDRSETGVMVQWMRADLERTKQDWLIAFWHHPPYTKGSHDSDKEKQLIEMRSLVMPVLESCGIDLVLTGHSHIYERSMLIDGAYATPTTAAGVILDDGDGDPQGQGPYRKSAGLLPHTGVVQIVAGHGGAKLGRVGTSPVMRRVVVEHGSVLIDVADDVLTGTMINRDGVQRDRFQLIKRGVVERKVVVEPRLEPKYEPPKKSVVDTKKIKDFPTGATALIAAHAEWDYLAGSHPANAGWTEVGYIAEEEWKAGLAGFGYDDNDDLTVLKDMRGKYRTVYIRREFELSPGDRDTLADFGLTINYDDAFIAYLNGKEILRVGVGKGSGKDIDDLKSHSASGYEYFSLNGIIDQLIEDDNVLAIEGHNVNLTSSDFTLDPFLVVRKKSATEKSPEK